jgi:transcriptional regulator with XRE-family HTH domain
MIHERLKKFFEENGISQQQVADNLGVSLQYINAILNGKKFLGKKNAERLANLYGLSKYFLLTGEGSISGDNSEPVAQKVVHNNVDQGSLMNAALAAKDETIASLHRELKTKEDLVESLRSQIAAKDDHIVTLKEQLAHLRRVVDEHGLSKTVFPFGSGAAETPADL